MVRSYRSVIQNFWHDFMRIWIIPLQYCTVLYLYSEKLIQSRAGRLSTTMDDETWVEAHLSSGFFGQQKGVKKTQASKFPSGTHPNYLEQLVQLFVQHHAQTSY
jgi:hypothetical protein